MGAEVFQIILVALSSALGFLQGLIIYILRDTRREFRDLHSSQEIRVAKIEENIGNLRAEIPIRYVLRDDFIRTMGAFDYKLERIDRKMGKLECVRRASKGEGENNEHCGK